MALNFVERLLGFGELDLRCGEFVESSEQSEIKRLSKEVELLRAEVAAMKRKPTNG